MALTTEEVPDPGRALAGGALAGGAAVGAQKEGMQSRQDGGRGERSGEGETELALTPAQKLPEVRGQTDLDWRVPWARAVQGGRVPGQRLAKPALPPEATLPGLGLMPGPEGRLFSQS